MATNNTKQVESVPETTVVPQSGTYSPVTVQMNNTVGAVFLGIIALMLLIALLKEETRQRGRS